MEIIKKNIIVVAILVALWCSVTGSSLRASETISTSDIKAVEGLVHTNYKALISIVSDQTISSNIKLEQLNKLVDNSIDFNIMTKLSAGSQHWQELSEDQQNQLTQSFKSYLQRFYAKHILKYSKGKVSFGAPTKKKNKIMIPIIIQTKKATYKLLYKLYRSKQKGWIVYDIEINGISLIKTYRLQFHTYLSQMDRILKEEFTKKGPEYGSIYKTLLKKGIIKQKNKWSAKLIVNQNELSQKLSFLDTEKKETVLQLLDQSHSHFNKLIQSLQ
jgi:phospholipid transport system substrate-binding protein